MTDFGSRPLIDGTTEAKQDNIITALGVLHVDLAKLHASAIHTMVDDITFDDDPTTYTSDSVDSSPYREFDLEIDLVIVDTPADIVIRVQFSDDDTTYYNYMNGPFGDIRYEDVAGNKKEVLTGKVAGDNMKIYVAATGTGTTHKFTLTVKVTLKK